MTKAQTHLERPVAFRTAARKVATIRGHEGREGGWIYNGSQPLVQGWERYGKRLADAGVIAQDPAHDGGNGKWFVNIFVLTSRELAAAERLWGEGA
jgi:hypothetical protein